MSILDIQHQLTNLPAVIAGALVIAAFIGGELLTCLDWRTK